MEYIQPELPDMPPNNEVIAPKELHFRYVLDHLIEVELIDPDHRAGIIEWWKADAYGD